MTNEELINTYTKLLEKKKEYEEDIRVTKMAIEKGLKDYMLLHEYRDDIKNDQKWIEKINEELAKLEELARTNNVVLSPVARKPR